MDYYDIRGYFAMTLHNCYENTFNMNVPKSKHAVLSRESVSFPTPTGRVTLGTLFRLDLVRTLVGGVTAATKPLL